MRKLFTGQMIIMTRPKCKTKRCLKSKKYEYLWSVEQAFMMSKEALGAQMIQNITSHMMKALPKP